MTFYDIDVISIDAKPKKMGVWRQDPAHRQGVESVRLHAAVCGLFVAPGMQFGQQEPGGVAAVRWPSVAGAARKCRMSPFFLAMAGLTRLQLSCRWERSGLELGIQIYMTPNVRKFRINCPIYNFLLSDRDNIRYTC
jgi:hypothetical protein